jgi:hypothetical protein
MTEDARFEDADEAPMALRALDEGDLKVLAALVQDAVFPASEMKWDRKRRRFAVLFNRFRWEEAGRRPPERVRALLVIEDALKVASQGIDAGRPRPCPVAPDAELDAVRGRRGPDHPDPCRRRGRCGGCGGAGGDAEGRDRALCRDLRKDARSSRLTGCDVPPTGLTGRGRGVTPGSIPDVSRAPGCGPGPGARHRIRPFPGRSPSRSGRPRPASRCRGPARRSFRR